MNCNIIYIDDEHDSRLLYEDILQEIYGDEFRVCAIPPKNNIVEMLEEINSLSDIVSIIIDEKLHVVAGANYQGSQLVEAIRATDDKLPLYILTSEVGTLDPVMGSVEHIIDKNNINDENYKKQYSMLMRRHINSFKDIKTERSKRFDELLLKSIEVGLTIGEQQEYENLDFIRVKKILATEDSSDTQEIERQNILIREIEDELKKLKGEQ